MRRSGSTRPARKMLAIALALKLEERLTKRTAPIAVVCNGKSGHAVARELADRSHKVRVVELGDDRSASRHGRRVYSHSPSLDGRAGETKGLDVTTDVTAIRAAEVVVISVPVPVDSHSRADPSIVIDAARQVAGQLRLGHLIVLRSKGYPGMTEELVRPILESTGLRVGQEIFLTFVSGRGGGRQRRPRASAPVVGGSDPISTRLGMRLVEEVDPRVVRVSSPATAEMASLLNSVLRSVTRALINQLTWLCHGMGLRVWEVIDAAASQYPAFGSFSPGLLDGHYNLTDPSRLAWTGRIHGFPMELLELAERINEGMPAYLVDRLVAVLQAHRSDDGPLQVLVLQGDPDDDGHRDDSLVVGVVEQLRRRTVEVAYHTPGLTPLRLDDFGEVLESRPLTDDLLSGVDCVVLLGDPGQFDYKHIVNEARLVFDPRNVTKDLVTGRNKIIPL